MGFGFHRIIRPLWRLANVLYPTRKTDWKIITFIFTSITLMHINYILFYHFRYLYSDEFIKIFRWYRHPAPCQTPEDVLQDMAALTQSAHKAMTNASLHAAVCYGTLWGALRQEAFLAWDNNVDFCVLDEELQRVPFDRLTTAFNREGITLSAYDRSLGSYKISKGKAVGFINMFFDCTVYFYLTHFEYKRDNPEEQPEERHHMACPMGLAPTAARFLHYLNKPFPVWILEPPFRKAMLSGVSVNVPHDNFEMQKYLYPDDWWLEVKPPGC